MAEFNFALEEEDLEDVNFCTGFTARKINDKIFVDAVGAIAQANGFDMDPESSPGENGKLMAMAQSLLSHHLLRHGEDILQSFDKAIKNGEDAIDWFRQKGYIK